MDCYAYWEDGWIDRCRESENNEKYWENIREKEQDIKNENEEGVKEGEYIPSCVYQLGYQLYKQNIRIEKEN